MPNEPAPLEDGEPRRLELSDFTHGAQSVKATCGCLAVALFLALVAFAARKFLFR